ncbi:MAG: VC_2705 family sodium/solute symporter [Bauldia sp.]|uniref:VC_2705 family sodium/solute symporter n=1 Tax=Bauldia sp. TaxID=2575872 RepID=UPI001D22B2E7|nr:VC_2705 family sodium/solute symporter [Bauldia sp.]MCB1496682.1 VC_2705 family sodium/solute symporter [Bauldia sp.]
MVSTPHGSRGVGKVFGLLTTAFALFVVVVAMLGEFGLPERIVTILVVAITVLAYSVLGILARTLSLADFYVAGRNVSAGFNGLATAAAFLSAAGFVGMAGAFFADESAGLALTVGWTGGFVILAVVVAPYYRKSGAVTLPDMLSVRFGTPLVRVLGIVVLLACSLPLLAAAIATAAWIGGLSLGMSTKTTIIVVCVVLLLSTLLGGMRGVTAVAGAQAIVILFGILTPPLIFSLQQYRLPIAQLTYGNAMAENALAGGSAIQVAPAGVFPVSSLDGFNLFALALCIAAGVVALPHVLARSGTTSDIAGARLSAAWGLLVVAVVAATAPAIAAFAKLSIVTEVVGAEVADLPQWLFDYAANGLAGVCGVATLSVAEISGACGASSVVNGLRPGDVSVAADAVATGFADITGLPHVLTALIAAAVLAAALATAGAAVITLGTSAGHDLYGTLINPRAPAGRRLIVSRLFVIIFLVLGGWLASTDPGDIFALAFAAPSLAAAGFFPAIILGIWWRRTTFRGVAAGMIAGFGVTAAYVALLQAGTIEPISIIGLTEAGISPAASAIIGAPLGFVVTVVVSLLNPAPSATRLAVVDAIRRPTADPVLEDHAV